MIAFLQLNPSAQSPPSLEVETLSVSRVPSVPAWSVIRDVALDIAWVLGVLVAMGMVIGLSAIERKHVPRQPLSPLLTVATLFLFELAFLYLGLRRLKINRGKGLTVKLFDGNAGRGILSGILSGAALTVCSIIYVVTIQKMLHLPLPPNPLRILRELRENTPLSVAFVLTASIVAPICEEVFFRANIFGSAKAINRTWLGAAMASVLFAFAHLSLVLSPYYIVFSLTMCWLFTKKRTIAAPIAAHMTVNAVACFAALMLRRA